eukprot:UN05681
MWPLVGEKTSPTTIKNAHNDLILSVDYNPNKPYQIASSGRDRVVKFWDLRKPKHPIKVLSGHNHWIWEANYNNR